MQKEKGAGLLISKYRVSPIVYRRYFSDIDGVIVDIFEKCSDKVSPILLRAWQWTVRLHIHINRVALIYTMSQKKHVSHFYFCDKFFNVKFRKDLQRKLELKGVKSKIILWSNAVLSLQGAKSWPVACTTQSMRTKADILDTWGKIMRVVKQRNSILVNLLLINIFASLSTEVTVL